DCSTAAVTGAAGAAAGAAAAAGAWTGTGSATRTAAAAVVAVASGAGVPVEAGSGVGFSAGFVQSSPVVGFSGLWPSAVAVRACWASPRMPAKASFGGGAPRAAAGAGLAGPWAALGEVSPFVLPARSDGKKAGGAGHRGRLAA